MADNIKTAAQQDREADLYYAFQFGYGIDRYTPPARSYICTRLRF